MPLDGPAPPSKCVEVHRLELRRWLGIKVLMIVFCASNDYSALVFRAAG